MQAGQRGGDAGAPVRTVLVADDSPDLRFLVRVNLEMDGRFAVAAEAADGVEAIRLARKMGPDAIVVDLSMPLMDGHEALPLLRAECPEAVIIVLSGFADRDIVERAMAKGADAFVAKGDSLSGLAEALHRTWSERSRAPGEGGHCQPAQ